MLIRDCMKHNVISIPVESTIGQAVRVFTENRIGTLPVVDKGGRLVGLLQLRDLLSLVTPDFVRLIEDFDFVHDFGAVETRQPLPEQIKQPISAFVQPPVAVEDSSGLLRAFSLLHKHRLLDLPVVDREKRLVGIASRVDIGVALLAGWQNDE